MVADDATVTALDRDLVTVDQHITDAVSGNVDHPFKCVRSLVENLVDAGVAVAINIHRGVADDNAGYGGALQDSCKARVSADLSG